MKTESETIQRAGARASQKGPAEHFTGSVRIERVGHVRAMCAQRLAMGHDY